MPDGRYRPLGLSQYRKRELPLEREQPLAMEPDMERAPELALEQEHSRVHPPPMDHDKNFPRLESKDTSEHISKHSKY